MDGCKYILECGWCELRKEKCEKLQKSVIEDKCDHNWKMIYGISGLGYFLQAY